MLLYGKNLADSYGCTHSIDNLIFEFVVKSFNADTVFRELAAIYSDTVPGWDDKKYSRHALPACAKYGYFHDSIWGGGTYIRYGHYRDFDRLTREWTVYPLLRVEFNPNKYLNSPVVSRLRKFFSEWCESGYLVKFDYAVDVPCVNDNIAVYSRKEPGLFKGTRYYGQRNKHGRLKIYDKKSESDLPADTTRVEWTFCSDKPIVFDDVRWLTQGPKPLPDVSELSPQTYTLARLILENINLGGDPRRCLSFLDYRTQKKLEPYTIGSGVQLLVCSDSLLALLRYYCSELSLSFRSGDVNPIVIGSGERCSFDDLESDEELPF